MANTREEAARNLARSALEAAARMSRSGAVREGAVLEGQVGVPVLRTELPPIVEAAEEVSVFLFCSLCPPCASKKVILLFYLSGFFHLIILLVQFLSVTLCYVCTGCHYKD